MEPWPCCFTLPCDLESEKLRGISSLRFRNRWRDDKSGVPQKRPGTNLIVQVFLGFERQVLVILSGQHVGADADGEVAGVHLVDLGVAADQVEHGDQVLQQQQVGPGELIGNPGMKVREVGFRGG